MQGWAEAVMAITGVVTLVTGAATAYLRRYVGHRLSQLQESLPRQFVPREIFEARLKQLDDRLTRLELEAPK